MRDFISIMNQDFSPLDRSELLETVSQTIPSYGYWVDPTGFSYPVERVHYQTLYDVRPDLTMDQAMKTGWVKITADSTFRAELYAGCITEAAFSEIISLSEDAVDFELDIKWDDTIQHIMLLPSSKQGLLFETHGDYGFCDRESFVATLDKVRL